CFRMYAQPPGPGLPEQAPSVKSLTKGREEEGPAAGSVMLPLAERDPSALGVVGRDFHGDAVTRHDTDEVLAHPPGDVRHHLVADVEFHDELRVGQSFHDNPLHGYAFFFRHNSPGQRVVSRRTDCRGPALSPRFSHVPTFYSSELHGTS